jgi:hypothetical protein
MSRSSSSSSIETGHSAEQTRIAGIPWASIVALRNRLTHGYDDVDHDIVWQIVTTDVPLLEKLLSAQFPSSAPVLLGPVVSNECFSAPTKVESSWYERALQPVISRRRASSASDLLIMREPVGRTSFSDLEPRLDMIRNARISAHAVERRERRRT